MRNAKQRIAGAVAMCAALLGAAQSTRAKPMYEDRPDIFPLAAWQQADFNFDVWKSRGINTMMEVPGGHEKQRRYWSNWHDQAVKRNFFIIRSPDPNITLAKDIQRPNLRSWMLRDEPDYREYSATQLQTDYSRLKAAAPQMPVTVNFSGGTVLGAATANGKRVSDATYIDYLKAADWVSSDIYPVTGWDRPDWIDYSQSPADRKTPGMALDKLSALSAQTSSSGLAKPQWAVIETSDQNLNWLPSSTRGPTEHEVRGEVWHSIIHGAQGIVYFSHTFNPFHFDATPANVGTELTSQHKRIQKLARVLNTDRTPGADRGHVTGAELAFPASNEGRLEGTWRHYEDGDYFFVLNMSANTVSSMTVDLLGVPTGSDNPFATACVVDEARSLTAQSATRTINGQTVSVATLNDTFDPWEVHVYKFPGGDPNAAFAVSCDGPGMGSSMAALPEPGAAGMLAVGTLVLLRRGRRLRPVPAT